MIRFEDIDIFKAKAAIGEIREWKGVKYQKKANGQWIPLQKKKEYPKFEKFGTNYSQFENKPEEAINFLLKRKQGQVIGAWDREGFGKIDIIWGNNDKGLQHIRKRHFIEQDDFQSLEDISKKISEILKNGKIGKPYQKGNKVDFYKGDFKVTLVKEVTYDEEDNFRDKIWILTSYDNSRSIEDKIRKATSDEIALEKNQVVLCPNNSSVSSRKNHLEKGQTNIVISQCSFSENKDMLKKSFEQQFSPEYFEKAKKGAPLGTIKEFGGKKYIKAENGWKYYGKKKGSSQEEESSDKPKEVEVESKEKDKVSELDQFATKATDKQLEAAMKDPEQTEAVKKIAKEELEKRKGKSEEETIDLSEKEDKKQVLIDHLKQQVKLTDKQIEVLLSMFSVDEMYKNMKSKEKSQQKEKTEKQSEIKKEDKKEETPKSGFKKITQTYVKVGDGNIIIKMQGDDRYKATKGKFSLLSEPNESLADFKKKVKEQYEDRSKLKEEIKSEIKKELKEEIKPTEKQIKTNENKEKERDINDEYTKEVVKEYIERAHGEVNPYFLDGLIENEIVTEKAKISEREMTEVERKLKTMTISKAIEEKSRIFFSENSEKLKKLSPLGESFNGVAKNKSTQLAYNLALIRDGQKPYLSPMFYKDYNGNKYNVYDQSKMSAIDATDKAMELCYEKETYSEAEIGAIVEYTCQAYGAIRKFLVNKNGKSKSKHLKEVVKNIESFIEKSPLKENIVLSRRIHFNDAESFGFYQSLKPGDFFRDPSFTSFSLSQNDQFGDFQITCLAKKSQSFAAVETFSSVMGENEFIAQKNMRYKVLETGKNSIVIEVVD